MNFLKKNSRYISDLESFDFSNYIQKTLPDANEIFPSNRSTTIPQTNTTLHQHFPKPTHTRKSQSLDQPCFSDLRAPNQENFNFLDFSVIQSEKKLILEEIHESLQTYKKKHISDLELSIEDLSPKYRENYSEVFNRNFVSFYDGGKLNKTLGEKNNTALNSMQFNNKFCCISRHLSIRESLSESLKEFSTLELIDFFKAYGIYSKLGPFDLRKKQTWKKNFFSELCSCFRNDSDLDFYTAEACEKFVDFGYTEYNNASHFHRCLLFSAGSIIFDISHFFGDAEIRFENLLEKLAVKSKMILSVLMNILFLDSFFKDILLKFKESFGELKNFRVIFRLSKICMRLLRRKKMNSVLSKTQKKVELIFFLFAGICIYFINVSKEFGKDAYRQVLVFCEEKIEDVLSISREFYINRQN